MHNQRVGKFGEDLAKKYLVRRGYKIISNNIKISYLEIDIIAKKNGLLVFVEVKTRISQFYGSAEEAYFANKGRKFKKGIELYLKDRQIFTENIRADLITVDINRSKKTVKIKHYQDII